MSRKRETREEAKGCIAFLEMPLAPFVLIIAGLGAIAFGLSTGSTPVMVIGAVLTAAGLLWGGLLYLMQSPLDVL